MGIYLDLNAGPVFPMGLDGLFPVYFSVSNCPFSLCHSLMIVNEVLERNSGFLCSSLWNKIRIWAQFWFGCVVDIGWYYIRTGIIFDRCIIHKCICVCALCTGIPHFIVPYFIVLQILRVLFVCFFLTLPIEGKILHQQKIMITLLRYLTHCSGLEPNPVYL